MEESESESENNIENVSKTRHEFQENEREREREECCSWTPEVQREREKGMLFLDCGSPVGAGLCNDHKDPDLCIPMFTCIYQRVDLSHIIHKRERESVFQISSLNSLSIISQITKICKIEDRE